MPFTFERTTLDGLFLIKPTMFRDGRGFFMETFARKDFESAGIRMDVVQINHSRSLAGVLRGLHFQYPPHEQSKLVRCTRGEILDVAVDIRPGSASFARHFSTILSDTDELMVYVPRGFAHGFVVLSESADVEYAVDNLYAPDHAGGIVWNDPTLAIRWPHKNPILADKDKQWPALRDIRDSLH